MQEGVNESLATRITEKKALWLLRLSDADLGQIHEYDFSTMYLIQSNVYDIVEVAAIHMKVRTSVHAICL